jgi:signal transduction histidine kinase
LSDGKTLAEQCLQRLADIGNTERFPPKLLILLASPEYLLQQKAELLLAGVYETFSQDHPHTQLIGSSVGGVFFDRRLHPKGALLICLASKLIAARVGVGRNARQDAQGAIRELLRDLELVDSSRRIAPTPLANRLIVTFMPGCNQEPDNGALYPAPGLHRLLCEGVRARISMTGGVSSANDLSRRRDGFQFIQQQVLRDSVVAASIISGVPIGVSLNDSLLGTDKVLCVTKVGEDNRTILEFDGKSPREQLDFSKGNVMLARLSADDERSIDIPLPLVDGSVQMLKQVKDNDYFEVFRQGPQIIKTVLKGIKQARRRVYVKRPIASLVFPSTSYNPRHERDIFNWENALTRIENALQKRPCVGGFFDGEIGVDEKGRSRLTNGGVGYVIFGDEIREPTALYEGVSALATYGSDLLVGSEWTPDSYNAAIDTALKMVYQTGFPGAMISLVQSSLDRESGENQEFVIACRAIGSRFEKTVHDTKRPHNGADILELVFRRKEARLIRDSRADRSCDAKAVGLSGIVSQYILPLRRMDESIFGTLQVDLGDLSHLSEDEFRKTETARMLDCFAEVIGAGIDRITNAIKNKITLRLDHALRESLSASSVHDGLEKFVAATRDIFGVEMGQLRLIKYDDVIGDPIDQILVLETGFGTSYEAEKESRSENTMSDGSPICCALDSDEPQVVNDVHDDPAFQSMLMKSASDRNLFDSLNSAKSYATVAFKDAQNKPLGAISLGSTTEWFFQKYHQEALVILAERLSFLVEHVRAKVRLKFLLDVRQQAERSQLAMQTAGIYVFQHAHRLGNAIQSLYRLAREVRSAQDESTRIAKVGELESLATSSVKMIEWVINLGQLAHSPKRDRLSLYSLIEETSHEVVTEGYKMEFSESLLTDQIAVRADRELTREVFINLITNAIDAMKRKEKAGETPKLKVSAVVSENKETVQIIFEDNGAGMTPAEMEAAASGFAPAESEFVKHRHKGVGVLISQYLLRVQGGSLNYKSEVGRGTQAIITLPHF